MTGPGSPGTSVCQLTCEDHFTVPRSLGDNKYQTEQPRYPVSPAAQQRQQFAGEREETGRPGRTFLKLIRVGRSLRRDSRHIS